MVFSSCSNDECFVASTSEATASSPVFTTEKASLNISNNSNFLESKLKKKDRTSRWEQKSVEYLNSNSKINIDLINFQKNIISSNLINKNNYSNKIDAFNSQQSSPSIIATSSTKFGSIPSFNTVPNFNNAGFFHILADFSILKIDFRIELSGCISTKYSFWKQSINAKFFFYSNNT